MQLMRSPSSPTTPEPFFYRLSGKPPRNKAFETHQLFDPRRREGARTMDNTSYGILLGLLFWIETAARDVPATRDWMAKFIGSLPPRELAFWVVVQSLTSLPDPTGPTSFSVDKPCCWAEWIETYVFINQYDLSKFCWQI